jgi:hypothetical protein
MGKDPSDIRTEIKETRARVGNEVDALSYKTDVGARVGDYVDEKKQSVKSTLTSAKDKVVPGTGRMKRAASHLRDTAESNPMGLAVGGLAVGFLVGTVLPQTRIENEQMGEISDRLIETARETGREALERGTDVAQEAAAAAVETAKESGRDQGSELASNLQERTQQSSGGNYADTTTEEF